MVSKSLDMKEWLLVHEERISDKSNSGRIMLRILVSMKYELNAEKYVKN